jgi:hypothetical protein
MSMTKKELAEREELRRQLRLARAFRFTEKVERDVPPPETSSSFGALTKGFLYNAYHNSWRVEPACSSCVSHAFGRDDKTDSQQPCSLYSTRLLALKALRNDAEQQCAKWLAEIDTEIEKETANERTH